MSTWDYDELEVDVSAVYAVKLPIPPWWPAEDRSAFIDIHAAQAASAVAGELDDIVDRVADQRYRQVDGHLLWDDEVAAIIAAEQQCLLDEARSTLMWNLAEAIAEQSAWLTAEAVFAHPRRGQSRYVVLHENGRGG